MELSKDRSVASLDRTNNVFNNCIRDGFNGYFKEQLLWEAVLARNQQMSQIVLKKGQMPEDKSFSQIKFNIPNMDMKDSLQYAEDRMSWGDYKVFDKPAAEIDWDSISKNLIEESSASGLSNSNFHLASFNNVSQSKSEHFAALRMFERIYLQNLIEENALWPHTRHPSNGDFGNMLSGRNNELENGVIPQGEDLGFSKPRSPTITAIESESKMLNDQGFLFTTPVGMIPTEKKNCLGNMRNDPHYLRPSIPPNHGDNLPKSSEIIHAEGEYLFSEDLVQKRKYRLLVGRESESQMRTEIIHDGLSSSDMIKMKFRSYGIPVEVEPYRRQDQDKTNVKAFNILFKNPRDVRKALKLVERGQLFLSLREARPSPTFHVKYEVMHPAGVFVGKSFRQQIHQLQKGDIVTANQLKGNKVRIIKWCPKGCWIDLDLPGWVLLQKKEIYLLRRMQHWEEEKLGVKPESRSTVVKPPYHNRKIFRQPSSAVQTQISQTTNPKRVSATNISPFKVLVEVDVRKGRKEPTIVGRLKPGNIVWANQHKGSMLRIINTNHSGNIVYDSTLKPEVWGWVCLQRRGDEKPCLLRILNSAVTKTKETGKVQLGRGKVRSTAHIFADRVSNYQDRKSRSKPRSRASKIAGHSSWSPSEKHCNTHQLHNSDITTTVPRHIVKAKGMLDCKEDMDAASSIDRSKSQMITQHAQSYSSPGMIDTLVPTNMNHKTRNMRGGLNQYKLVSIPSSINCSGSESPMSTSSIS